jgi:hypothetical protein
MRVTVFDRRTGSVIDDIKNAKRVTVESNLRFMTLEILAGDAYDVTTSYKLDVITFIVTPN